MKQIHFHLSEIKEIAAQLWDENKHNKCWVFNAPMGAGKTTFIHALCDVLKVSSSVSSPTFAIINEYTSADAGIIYHIDWYRVKNEMEAIQAGCEDCIESGNYCFIEWAEKFPNLLPLQSLHISFEVINYTERKLSIHTQ